MSVATLNTNKSWATSLGELRDEFRKWGVKDFMLPSWRASRTEVTVSFSINGKWSNPTCSRYPTREQNLRAIVMAIQAVRLASQRGIGELIAEASKHLALPPGPSPADPYVILGIPDNSEKDRIFLAYRKRLFETHPDRGGDQEEFKKVIQAGKDLGVG